MVRAFSRARIRRAISGVLAGFMLALSMPGLALAMPGASPAAEGFTPVEAVVEPSAITQLTGTVTDAETGDPVQDAYVYIYPDSGWEDGDALTNASGVYTISELYDWDADESVALYADGYSIEVYADGYEYAYVHTTVTSGVSNVVDVELTPLVATGLLTMRALDADTSQLLSDETKFFGVYSVGDSGLEYVDSVSVYGEDSWEFQLPVGSYIVYAWAEGHTGAYWEDTSAVEFATPVVVTEDGSQTIDSYLTETGTGTLTVTTVGSDVSNLIEEIDIAAFRTGPLGEYMEVYYGMTGDTDAGITQFTLTGGDFKVLAYDSKGKYAYEFYDDQQFESQADTVSVTSGGHASIGFTLDPAVTIGGTNRDLAGEALPVPYGDGFVEAYAYDSVEATWTAVVWNVWNEDGTYVLDGLHPGTAYRVASYVWDESLDDFHTAWYAAAGSVDSVDDADDVTVADVLSSPDDIDMFFDVDYAEMVPEPVDRVYGDNRYETGVAISEKNFPYGADTVIIATGLNFPDALSASALAGVYDAPLLLTNPEFLSPEVALEIERLGASEAIVVGGEAAVKGAVVGDLYDVEGIESIRRIEGADRYKTAAAVAEEVVSVLGEDYSGEAFLVRGDDFADALAASPFAYSRGIPVLLTATASLTPSTKDCIESIGATDIVIAGGSNVVSTDVAAAVDRLAGVNVGRVSGTNRYATAVALAKWGISKGYANARMVGIATGTNFPDALGGGAACGANGGVLLMTNPLSLSSEVSGFISERCDKYTAVQVFGSSKAVANAVATAVHNLLR